MASCHIEEELGQALLVVVECLHSGPFDWAFVIETLVVADNGSFDPVELAEHKLVVAASDTFPGELDPVVVVDSSSFVRQFVRQCLALGPFAFVEVVEHKPLVVGVSFVVLEAAGQFVGLVAVAFDSSWMLVGSYS